MAERTVRAKEALEHLLAMPHSDLPVLTSYDLSTRIYWHDLQNVVREWDGGQWRQMLTPPQVTLLRSYLESLRCSP